MLDSSAENDLISLVIRQLQEMNKDLKSSLVNLKNKFNEVNLSRWKKKLFFESMH